MIKEAVNTSPPAPDESPTSSTSKVTLEEDLVDTTVSDQVTEPESEHNEPMGTSASDSIKERLETVKDLEEQGLIDAEQAKKKRDEILGEL